MRIFEIKVRRRRKFDWKLKHALKTSSLDSVDHAIITNCLMGAWPRMSAYCIHLSQNAHLNGEDYSTIEVFLMLPKEKEGKKFSLRCAEEMRRRKNFKKSIEIKECLVCISLSLKNCYKIHNLLLLLLLF